MEWVVMWLLFGFVAMIIANSKGRSGCGWLILGILIGPFALVVALLPSAEEETKREARDGTSNEYRKCPFCAEVVRREAVKCRFCQSDLPPPPPPPRGLLGELGYKAGKSFNQHP